MQGDRFIGGTSSPGGAETPLRAFLAQSSSLVEGALPYEAKGVTL